MLEAGKSPGLSSPTLSVVHYMRWSLLHSAIISRPAVARLGPPTVLGSIPLTKGPVCHHKRAQKAHTLSYVFFACLVCARAVERRQISCRRRPTAVLPYPIRRVPKPHASLMLHAECHPEQFCGVRGAE